jgi:hypothetical protein
MGITKHDFIKYNNINGTLYDIWKDKETVGLADKHADHWLASKRANIKIQENYDDTKENKYSVVQ